MLKCSFPLGLKLMTKYVQTSTFPFFQGPVKWTTAYNFFFNSRLCDRLHYCYVLQVYSTLFGELKTVYDFAAVERQEWQTNYIYCVGTEIE